MGALTELDVEFAERGEDRPRLHDRIDAEMWTRPMGRTPFHFDLRPDEALVRHDHRELGRLGHDRRVGTYRTQHLLHADARVLLVRNGGNHDVTGEPAGGCLAPAMSAAARPAFMS